MSDNNVLIVPGTDYEFPDDSEDSFWVRVRDVSLYIRPQGNGVLVEAFENGKEMDNEITSMVATPFEPIDEEEE